MELWVRSQDKERLQKCDIVEFGIWNNENRIYINGERLGTYKTKERALEVLDEIQKYIILPNTDNSGYVYEMPQE